MTAAGEGNSTVIQRMVERLREGYAPQKVILFGSRARGTARPDSDIDLLVIKETSERFIDRWVRVRQVLSDPERTIPLETMVLTPQEVAQRLAIGDQFVETILREGTVLYAA